MLRIGNLARLVAGVLAVAVLAGCSGTGSPEASPTRTEAAAPAVAVVDTTRLSGQMVDITIDSPAVGSRVKVRLLLPSRFESSSSRRWPVLYLLHGCCDSYRSWTRSSDVEQLARSLDALVVMPEGGRAGFYSNWLSGPAWETFHLEELPEVLTDTYRASDRRVVAGVSMGGLGALGYAARNPGMFRAAVSISGIVHTRLTDAQSRAYLTLIQFQGEDPQRLWGDPDSDADVWKAHNPYDLAPKLAGTRLFVSAGNGRPGPLDFAGTGEDAIEASIGAENDAFAQRIRDLGLDARIRLYGPGTHNWNYWQRELHKAWPLISHGLDAGGAS